MVFRCSDFDGKIEFAILLETDKKTMIRVFVMMAPILQTKSFGDQPQNAGWEWVFFN